MISPDEKLYWILLSGTPGIGPITFMNLLNKFGSAKAVWKSSVKELEHQKVSKHIITLIQRRQSLDPKKYYLGLVRRGFEVITLKEKQYPAGIKSIQKAPPVLYFRGSLLEEDNNSIAMVGTRKPTLHGRKAAEKLASGLSQAGFTIISGLARGIDGVAHRTALENGGRTIAFLGGGIDKVTPSEHRVLAEKIVKNGCLISEFPPGLAPDRGNFPARNRLISAMSKGVVIVEGLSKSGTRHTANHAIDQGRPIFSVPGPITSPLSDAPMDMLDEGSVLVRKAEDIIKVVSPNLSSINHKSKISQISFDSKNEETVYNLLKNEPLDSDQIIRLSAINTTDALTTISMLEIKGFIKNYSGKYQIV